MTWHHPIYHAQSEGASPSPNPRVEHPRKLAPKDLRDNFNGLVARALEEFIRSREYSPFSEGISLMARDPAIRYESEKISEEFAGADMDVISYLGDGLSRIL